MTMLESSPIIQEEDPKPPSSLKTPTITVDAPTVSVEEEDEQDDDKKELESMKDTHGRVVSKLHQVIDDIDGSNHAGNNSVDPEMDAEILQVLRESLKIEHEAQRRVSKRLSSSPSRASLRKQRSSFVTIDDNALPSVLKKVEGTAHDGGTVTTTPTSCSCIQSSSSRDEGDDSYHHRTSSSSMTKKRTSSKRGSKIKNSIRKSFKAMLF